MRKKAIMLIILLVIALVLIFYPGLAFGQDNDAMVKATLTVEAEIQTEDLWTTGETAFNEWAKPMYYIWLDDNGNSADARYGNGAGPSTHQIRFDTGRLYIEVLNGEITTYGPIYETSAGSNEWADTENNIQASIINNKKSLQVTFPLSLINNPSTLEISAMASPWTTSALDNTGSGSGNVDGWIIISDTSVENSYEEMDVTNEVLSWPSGLSNNESISNFNIEKIEAQLYFFDEVNGDGTETAQGLDIWFIIFIVVIIIIIIDVIIFRKKR